MYSESDLDAAVAAGAIDVEAAAGLRAFVAMRRAAPAVDEEHFRLVSSFNDIFVSIAALLSLTALGWLSSAILPELGGALIAAASWGCAEYFTRRRRMALPSIVLLLSFVGGVFAFGVELGIRGSASAARSDPLLPIAFGAALAAAAAFGHWWRFKVPITVAAGVAAVIALSLTLLLGLDPAWRAWLNPFLLIVGLAVFMLAMWWDASDRERRTRRSDVAFWLHLLSAPLIIHPLFGMLGLAGSGAATPARALGAVAIYFGLALVALAVDRRALLVSALAYVVYATSALFRAAGSLSQSFALTALTIGGALLLLSVFWHPVRSGIMGLLPEMIRRRLPAA